MRILIYILLVFVLSFGFSGCASQSKEEIQNSEITTVQLLLIRNLIFQRNFDLAIEMLRYVKEQNPEDMSLHVEIDYEIAFSFWKKKDIEESKKHFEKLIAFYDENDAKDIPQWPYFLSKKILEDKIIPSL